jgi:hypothetical protein
MPLPRAGAAQLLQQHSTKIPAGLCALFIIFMRLTPISMGDGRSAAAAQ